MAVRRGGQYLNEDGKVKRIGGTQTPEEAAQSKPKAKPSKSSGDNFTGKPAAIKE